MHDCKKVKCDCWLLIREVESGKSRITAASFSPRFSICFRDCQKKPSEQTTWITHFLLTSIFGRNSHMVFPHFQYHFVCDIVWTPDRLRFLLVKDLVMCQSPSLISHVVCKPQTLQDSQLQDSKDVVWTVSIIHLALYINKEKKTHWALILLTYVLTWLFYFLTWLGV